MDYSKTHYYKFSNSTTTSPRKSTIPNFERDDMPATQGNSTRTAQDNSRRSNQDTSFSPGFGPDGDVMPMIPSENQDTSFSPGFGPNGDVMPSLPSNGSVTAPSKPNTGNNNILWSWAFLSPIFSNISAVAQARFYNVNSLQEPLDIYMNGQLVVSDLDYSEYTDYLYIIPGYYNLTVYRRINPDVPIINARVSFARNSTCLVSILGTTNDFSLQFIC